MTLCPHRNDLANCEQCYDRAFPERRVVIRNVTDAELLSERAAIINEQSRMIGRLERERDARVDVTPDEMRRVLYFLAVGFESPSSDPETHRIYRKLTDFVATSTTQDKNAWLR